MLAATAIFILDWMISLGATITGKKIPLVLLYSKLTSRRISVATHPEDFGLLSYGILLEGEVKIWVIIHPDHDNVIKYRQLVNLYAVCSHLEQCPGICGDRSFVFMTEVLTVYGIRFSIVKTNLTQDILFFFSYGKIYIQPFIQAST